MRRTWKRVLSALLTVAMIATLLVVPAGAAVGDTSGFTADKYEVCFVDGEGDSAVGTGKFFAYEGGTISSNGKDAKGVACPGPHETEYTSSEKIKAPTLTNSKFISFTAPKAGKLTFYCLSSKAALPENMTVNVATETSEGAGESITVNMSGNVGTFKTEPKTKYTIGQGKEGSSAKEYQIYHIVWEGSAIDVPTGDTVDAIKTGINANITTAKGENENVTVSMEECNTQAVAEALVASWYDGVDATKFTVTSTVTGFNAATAGDSGNINGTAGSFTYSISVVTAGSGDTDSAPITGTVDITATAWSTAATAVTIKKGEAEAKTLEVKEGETVQLIADVEPDYSTDTVAWTQSDQAVATVSETGLVTGVKMGTGAVRATAGEIVAECKVTVVGPDQTGPSYTFDVNKMANYSGGTTLSADVKYDNYFKVLNNGKITEVNKTWSEDSSTTARKFTAGGATKSSKGIQFTVSQGKAADVKIWWIAEGDGRHVTMLDKDGEAVAGAPDTTANVKSGSCYITTFEAPAAGTYCVGSSGSNNSIARIVVTERDPKVLATKVEFAHKEGHFVYEDGIAANVGGPENLKPKYPKSWQMSASVTEPSGATDKSVTYSVADNSNITVSATGLVTAVKADAPAGDGSSVTGTPVTATAKDGSGVFATCQVRVLPYIKNVAIANAAGTAYADGAKESVSMAGTLTLKANVEASVSATALDKAVNWTASPVDAVTLTPAENGASVTVTPLKTGDVTITATRPKANADLEEDKTDTLTVTVGKGTISSLSIAARNPGWDSNGGTAKLDVTLPNGVPASELDHVNVTCSDSTVIPTKKTEGNTTYWEAVLPANSGSSQLTYTFTATHDSANSNWEVVSGAPAATCNVTVAALGANVITVQYANPDINRNLRVGDTLTMTAKASLNGTEDTAGTTLKYQWYKDNQAITNETNKTFTKTVALTDAGTYYCSVTNQDGDVTGRSADLAITVKNPLLTNVSLALDPVSQDGVAYSAGTLTITGNKTATFAITTTPAVYDDTLKATVETPEGTALVNAEIKEGKLTITPNRASETTGGGEARKVTVSGTTAADVKAEFTVSVKKTAAPAVLTANDVEVSAPTVLGGKGKIKIKSPAQNTTYRYKTPDAQEWIDMSTTTNEAEVAPGQYMVRIKVDDPTFQEISASLTVTVPAFQSTDHTVTVNGQHLATKTVNGTAYTNAAIAVADGTDVTVVVTAATGYTLPEDITARVGAQNLMSDEYTWNQATGTLTIAAAKVTGDVIVIIDAVSASDPDACCSAANPHKTYNSSSTAKEAANMITVAQGSEHWFNLYGVNADGVQTTTLGRFAVKGYTGNSEELKGDKNDWTFEPTGIIAHNSNIDKKSNLFEILKEGDTVGTVKLKNNSTPTVTFHVVSTTAQVTYTLTGLTKDANAPATVNKGETLNVTLTPAAGKLLPETITVTMGGTALVAGTGYTYSKDTGAVSVPNVTDAVVITATGADKPKDESVTAVTLKNGAADAGDTIDMELGTELTLTAEVTAAAEATNKAVVWSSDKADVVSVDNGKLTALKAGTATITATADANPDVKDTVTINVLNKAVVITPVRGGAMKLGDRKTLTAKVMVGDTEKAEETADITWSSSSASVATVDEHTGAVSAEGAGVAVITATSHGLSATYTVVVYDSADTNDANQKPGTFEATASASTGDIAAGTQLGSNYFTVVGDGVKYQDKSGNVITLGAQGANGVQFTVTGKATVTASVKSTSGDNHSVVGLLNVATGKLMAADGQGATTEISGQTSQTLTWTNLPAGTYQLIAPKVETTATTDAANPNKRGYCIDSVKAVQAAISAEDLIATAVKVTDAAGKTAATLKAGASVTLSAAVTPATAPQAVTWAVADGLTKVEKDDGTVTVTVAADTAPGAYKVTATSANGAEGANVVGEFTITVPVAVTGVEITGDTTVKVRESITLTAKVAPDNATEQGVTWSSSDDTVATVDQTGKVTGKAEGKVTITAASKEDAQIKGELEIEVKPADVKPGETTYMMDPTQLADLAANTALNATNFAPASSDGYFTVDGDVKVKTTTSVELAKAGKGSISFTVGADMTADVILVVSSTANAEDPSKTSSISLKKGTTVVENNEGVTTVGGNESSPTTLTYTGLAAGTYTVITDGTDRGVRVLGITVTEKGEGGDEPTPPTPGEKVYKISVDTAIVGGTVSVSKTEAKAGETITVTATPAAHYELDKITVDGAAITGTTFTMPGKDVTVSASFKAVTLADGEYFVDCDTDIVGGTVSTDKAKAKAGDTVTVTATPATGYELDAISVKTASGKAVTVTDGKFTMPGEDVKVSATFKKTSGGGDEPTPPTPDKVDRTALEKALADAKAIDPDSAFASEDGKDVPTTKTWVTQAVKDALAKAIADAEALGADADQAAVDAATKALEDAVKAWEPKAGTKRTSIGGGGSSSSGSSTGKVVASVTNPAGGKTTVKKDHEGNVTITATDAKGEVIAEVKLPATIPSVGYKFVDVPAGHWAEKAINDMAGLALVKGVNEDAHIFDMTSPITRGAVATILSRLANGKTGLECAFTDVTSGQWFTDGVAWAAKAGVVTGFEDGTFEPDGAITREQLAVMIARYAKLLGLDTSAALGELAVFSDAESVQAWAREGMAWCVKMGILQGRGDSTVDPSANASRAEATAMLNRLVELMK